MESTTGSTARVRKVPKIRPQAMEMPMGTSICPPTLFWKIRGVRPMEVVSVVMMMGRNLWIADSLTAIERGMPALSFLLKQSISTTESLTMMPPRADGTQE